MTTTTSVETARRAALRVGVILPIAIGVLGTLAIALMLPSLPAEVPVHWGVSGPDAWGPAWIYVVWMAALGIGMPALYSVFFSRTRRFGRIAAFLPAVILGITLFVVSLTALVAFLLDSPLAAWLPMTVAAVLAVVVTVVAWIVMPKLETDAPIDVPAAIQLADGQTAAWTGTAGGWQVHAGPSGLRVRGRLGWWRFSVPAGDIAEAGVVDIDPMSDFGGWGMRVAPGVGVVRRRFGLVTRAGEALEVIRRDGRAFVITVDDARTAAAVLNAVRTA